MFFTLFLAFTLIPIVEIYLLIKIGSQIGILTTMGIVIFTGITGSYLARTQGMQTFLKLQSNMAKGVLPTEELLDGFLILLAGVTLLTPGFLTDMTGLLILFPPTRLLLKRWLKNKFQSRQVYSEFSGDPNTVEGDYEVYDDSKPSS